MSRLALAALLAAAGLSGCAWPKPKADPTQFFVLTSAPVKAAAREPRPVVELQDVEVPEYLSNPRMAARTGENRIDYAEFKRWAEPLPQGVARALRESLAPVADLRAAPYPKAALKLVVRVTALEGLRGPEGAGSAEVKAAWELRNGGGRPRRGAFKKIVPGWDGIDYARLAALESEGLRGLCTELARALSDRP